MLRILLAVTALLIYGSLYPWQFHEAARPGGPVEALLSSWQFSLNRFFLRDVALNIAIYIPFGAAAYLWLHARSALVRFAIPLILAAALSTSIELTQFYDAHRFTSLVDVATNVTGAALGMLLALPVARRQSAYSIRIAEPGALLLFACWLGAMLFPLIPDLSHTHLNYKILTFFSGTGTTVSLVGLLALWLVAARMFSAVFGGGSTQLVFPLLSLVLPARFLITGLEANWTYWATFAAAFLLWTIFFAGPRHHDSALGWLVVASLLLTGLSPFHFSPHPGPFSWIPLRALFRTDWESGFALFLRKAFLYGSATWLFHQAGIRLRTAAVAIATGLAVVEAIQMFLPNHVAEITDPLMALFMAWLIYRLSRAVARSKNQKLTHNAHNLQIAEVE